MQIQAWSIISMPQVVWSRAEVMASRFEHGGTQIQQAADRALVRRGQTIWWMRIAGQSGAIAWDWVEVREGIVTMVDPMALLSNIAIDSTPTGEQFGDRLVALNEWVHRIPWQTVVSAELKGADKLT